jgi:hypothetical protein
MVAPQGLRIRFSVSPFMNLYYSLEVATGSIKEAYNEEFAKRMKEIFPEDILERFARLSNNQRFSWLLKSCLSREISRSKLEKSLLSLAREYHQLLTEAFSSYQGYWKQTQSSLLRVKGELEKVRESCQSLITTVSEVLNLPLKTEKLDVYILDAPAGEPIDHKAIAYGASLQVPFFALILHETTHILVGEKIRLASRKYTSDEHAEYVDEAIMNLITKSVLSRLEPAQMKELVQTEKSIRRIVTGFPPHSDDPKTEKGREALQRHDKRNSYIKYYIQTFETDWSELVKQKKDFHQLVTALLQGNANRIKQV